jgi:hypothetical protein
VGAGPFRAVNKISLGIKINGGQRPVEVPVEEANWPEGGHILDPFMAPIRPCLTLLHYYYTAAHTAALLLCLLDYYTTALSRSRLYSTCTVACACAD